MFVGRLAEGVHSGSLSCGITGRLGGSSPSSSPDKSSCLWRSQQEGCSVYLATGRVDPGHARLQLPGLIVMSSVVPIRPGLNRGLAVAQELELFTPSTRDRQASFSLVGLLSLTVWPWHLTVWPWSGAESLLPWLGYQAWCPSAGFLVWSLI